ncbi:bifunctional diaminohydroxyphosphoribosylaminopyrimidine deaminase/5-amino-6-(5-phosphoribosylamino)uracil reductase RibD [Sulfitobacter geojensis]|uniref:bifunctional diaminohydroxyphosphoribosylaminopyrimidine deaminase/5-amino-6-(5-phosphoribosylamino)uracil reductase RibD n=1 Tax=Sulfitobacter geojensis TaxID=1342299 RepID=UPI003BAC732C
MNNATTSDARFMGLALSLGRRGMGRVWPNPAVGCVIVKAGRIVGRGWTQDGGRPHGETEALAQAGAAARGATAYVTLEPCSHHGKTPPCAEALIAAGVARVVVAITDSDARVDGKGIAMLRDAGITVDLGEGAEEAARDHAGFFARTELGRPFLTLKLANSFDGRIATGTGESQWITGAQARREVHAMRSRHDAVMVGGGTARKDDPSLTVRDLGIAHQPARVVVSRRLDLPLMGQLARTAKEVPLILCHGMDADSMLVQTWRDLGATLLACRATGSQLDPGDVLQQLGSHGLTRVFCEGGGALAASLLESDLVDDLVGFTAGVVIGAEGLPGIGAMGLARLSEAPRFVLRESRVVGPDVLQVWTRGQDMNG